MQSHWTLLLDKGLNHKANKPTLLSVVARTSTHELEIVIAHMLEPHNVCIAEELHDWGMSCISRQVRRMDLGHQIRS